jgi:hypothetical protein
MKIGIGENWYYRKTLHILCESGNKGSQNRSPRKGQVSKCHQQASRLIMQNERDV